MPAEILEVELAQGKVATCPSRGDEKGYGFWQAHDFKGGSSKSTSSVHLALISHCGGYASWSLDLDPKASDVHVRH